MLHRIKYILFLSVFFITADIFSQCNADFSLPVNSCQFNSVNFAFTGTAGQPKFSWNFGDGFSNTNTDTIANPVHKFNREGVYKVTLIISDTGGCRDTVAKQIRILKKPEASFTVKQTCADLGTQFTSTSTADSTDSFRTFLWLFGDGGTDYVLNPLHTYTSPGTKTVTLTINTWNGCMDTLVYSLPIFDRITLNINKDSVCQGDFVSFSMNAGTGTPGTYLWNFGDASSSYSQNSSHRYSSPGTYTPFATLYYSNGATCIKNGKPIKIHALPDPRFTILDSIQCYNYNSVCIKTKQSGNSLKYRAISFDDGFVNKTSPLTDSIICYNYTDSTGGRYTLSLDLIDKNGCAASYTSPTKLVIYPEIAAHFISTDVTGCFKTSFFATNSSNMKPPKVTSFKWDFGDDSINTVNWNPVSHTYTKDGIFNVSLILQNSDGCRDTFTRKGAVKNTSYPVDAVMDTALSLCRSTNLFRFRQSPITGGQIYWDFDNLDTAFIFNPDYHYPKPGIYFPKAHIIKNGCPTIIDLDTIFVYGPQAAIGNIVNQFQCSIRDTVILNNTSIYFNNRALKFFWDVGDMFASGCTSDSVNNVNVGQNCRYSVDSTYIRHMYSPGQEACYFPKLIITDTIIGCSDTAIGKLPLIRPDAKKGLKILAKNLCLGPEFEKAVELDLSRTQPGCGQETFYVMWDSACAAASSDFHSNWKLGELTHNYGYDICDSSGKISIGLVLQNGTDSTNSACSDTAWYHDILDFGRINPDFSTTYDPRKNYCKNSTFTFTVKDVQQDSLDLIHWDWGDGSFETVSDISAISHTFSRPGLFRVVLTLQLKDGCSAMDTMLIRIGFKSSLTITDKEICLGEIVKPIKNITYWNNSFNFWNDSLRSGAGLESVKWDFGDGNGFSSTVSSPEILYSAIGNYTIRMAMTDSSGCKDTITLVNGIRVFSIQSAFTTVMDTFTCAQLISFKSNVTVFDSLRNFGHPDDKIKKYQWTFGKSLSGSILGNPTKFFKAGEYHVKLLNENTRQCRDSFEKDIVVLGPTANFVFVGDSSGCQGVKVTMKNTSLVANAYTWNFGDSSNSSQYTTSDSNISFNYPEFGKFHPKLTAYANMVSNGMPITCSNTFPDTSYNDTFRLVTVFENPKPRFSHLTDCNNFKTSFTNLSVMSTDTIVKYEWDFGDGDTSMTANPIHQYPDTGRYWTVLKAYSSKGCTGETRRLVIIAPFPVVWFQTTSVCLGTAINFKDSTEAFNDQVKQWQWNFDDGTGSLLKNPIKTYTYDSVFNVSLTVTNYAGCKSSDTIQIRVHNRPKANFTFTNHCLSESIPLKNTTSSKETPVKYIWKLGDGDTSTKVSLNKLYKTVGNYTVTLKATNPFGCDDSISKTVITYPLPQADFTVNSYEQCQKSSRFIFTDKSKTDSGTLSYLWNFGDSSNSVLKNPVKNFSKAGTFEVSLTAINTYNCRDTTFDTLVVNPTVSAKYNIPASDSQCINSNVFNFIDLSSITSGSFSRKWDFGDNSFSTDSIILHRYKDTGNYKAKLMTLSDKNCPDTLHIAIRLHPKPKADFTINNTTQCQNTNNFIFSNISSAYYGNTSSRWFFGDGDSSTLFQGIHHYINYDTFTIRLIATNTSLCSDTISKTVIVDPIPQLNFTVYDSLPCEENNFFRFSNLSSIPNGALRFRWLFGDLKQDSLKHTTHTYDTFGIYKVSLLAWSSQGCSDTLEKNIEVFPMPFASFSINQKSQCENDQNFIFTNTSLIAQDSFKSLWLLGEKDSSVNFSTSKQFAKYGTYSIVLNILSSRGCKDSIVKSITVFPKPIPEFTINDSTQCINKQSFSFTNISTMPYGDMTYVWQFDNGFSDSIPPPLYRFAQYGIYKAKLTAFSDSGCIDSVVKTIEVFPKPFSFITVNDSNQCVNNNRFDFHANTSIPYGLVNIFYWNSNGSAYNQNDDDTTFYFQSTGYHSVGLVAESKEQCRDTSYLTINVQPKPLAEFSVNDSDQCANNNLFAFTNLSTSVNGALSYHWDFGNGTTDTVLSPQKIFNSADTLTVKLIVTDGNLCNDTFASDIIVLPAPKAAFSINDSSQCLHGNKFIVNNTSTIQTGNLTYIWETGDAYISNNLDTGHTYNLQGKYKIMLRATSSEACIDSEWHYNIVHPQPIADFTINKSSQCLNNQLFKFISAGRIAYGTLRYQWTLGDGSQSAGDSLSHQYAQQGFYPVKMIAISDQFCQDSSIKTIHVLAKPIMSFDVNNSNQCVNIQKLQFKSTVTIPDGKINKYYWDFDDGTLDSGLSASHYFNYSRYYNVKHTAISDSLCIDSIKQRIRIFPKPIARFTINDSAQCLRNNIYVLTDKSYDSFGIRTFDWDLGAGILASTPTVNHHYTDTGFKTIRLVVTSVNGCKDTAGKKIYVKRMPDATFSKPAAYYCQFAPDDKFIPAETGGTFYGKNIVNDVYHPIKLWKDTIKYGITVNGCFDSSIQYTNVFPAPRVDLGNDTQLCQFEYLELNAKFWNSKYKWGNTAVTDTVFTVIRPGIYFVTVSNICGVDSDTIVVTYKDNNCRFFMPNAFTPNNDDHNEFFRPFTVNVPEMSMQIYNRWGEKVYDGDQNSPGWDGTYMGQPAQQDVYIWVVFYRYPLNNKHIQIKEKGSFQLLR